MGSTAINNRHTPRNLGSPCHGDLYGGNQTLLETHFDTIYKKQNYDYRGVELLVTFEMHLYCMR